MSYGFIEEQNTLQPCPKCGKHALAQPRENLYRCLWCRFESDISETSYPSFGWFLFLVLFAAVFVIATAS